MENPGSTEKRTFFNMNIFDYPDGTYRVRADFTRLYRSAPETFTRWETVRKVGNGFGFVHIQEWPDYCKEDYSPATDSYTCEDYMLEIIELRHDGTQESKLNVVRKELQFDEKKVDDGISYGQWKEWAGEIITLQREDTRWVWEKLQRLEKLEKVIDQLRRI